MHAIYEQLRRPRYATVDCTLRPVSILTADVPPTAIELLLQLIWY